MRGGSRPSALRTRGARAHFGVRTGARGCCLDECGPAAGCPRRTSRPPAESRGRPRAAGAAAASAGRSRGCRARIGSLRRGRACIRGRGGQPGWSCTAQLVRRHRTACGTGCAVVGSRMGCRFNRPIAWVELESARGGVVVHASGPRGAAERGAARRTIVRRHRTACGIVPRSGWVADGVADSMSACYF